MEKFDINKEMAKLKGLNIIEKCSALDDLLDDLEDAQEQIICAKDEISEEYANVFKKKFHEEIASFIAETFDGKIPYVEKYGYQIMYDNRPIYITLYCICGEWSICLFVKSGSAKRILNDADASYLAGKYDFSGGEIENIARHFTIQTILHGQSENMVKSLVEFCENERLEGSRTKRKIGF